MLIISQVVTDDITKQILNYWKGYDEHSFFSKDSSWSIEADLGGGGFSELAMHPLFSLEFAVNDLGLVCGRVDL